MASSKLLLSLLPAFTLAGVVPLQQRSVTPQVATTQVLGNMQDPSIDRDSCTSSKVGDREFWTCRDSANYPGQNGFFYTSTASWTDFYSDGIPEFGSNGLVAYGDNSGPYFPAVQHDGCDNNGFCNDGSRWVGWPDTRPLPMQYYGGAWYMYSWIYNIHLNGLDNLSTAPYSCALYRSYFDNTDGTDLPPVTIINDAFWTDICYGNYGWTLSADNTTAYLYGKAENGIALAKVPLYSVEDKSQYQYYNYASNTWSTTAPSYSDNTAVIPNAGTTYQGTFYYSDYFGSYVWIGADYGVGTDFKIATAPNAEGPWTTPTLFYTAEAGNGGLGAYSQQAHPGLSQWGGQGKDIYLSYTKVDQVGSDSSDTQDTTPLIHVVWQ